jgi:HNH endonuclease
MKTEPVTHQQLIVALSYDPISGQFAWTNSRSGKGSGRKREIAGSKHSAGYVSIRLHWQLYLAHRLAWFYMTGTWPTSQIDHRNGIRNDNSWTNLREADNTVNQENQRAAQVTNKSGLLGVSVNHDNWSACIQVKGARRYLGTFTDPLSAHAAYISAKRQLHEGCTI